MDPRLHHQLAALEELERLARVWRQIALCTATTAVVEWLVFLSGTATGWSTRSLWWLVLLIGGLTAGILWLRGRQPEVDFISLIKNMEPANPALKNLYLTAAEQNPDPETGTFSFLQRRLIDQALGHPRHIIWSYQFQRRLLNTKKCQGFALVFLAITLGFSHGGGSTRLRTAAGKWMAGEIVVCPGDTELESGMGLVITARFDASPPAEATLVLVSASGKTKRLPLVRNLSDPVFGASLAEISEHTLYRVEYGGKSTRDYRIAVFDYPALARADADLFYPHYTGLTNRTIRDTLRISAVEGTQLTYTMQLNKPVARARLMARDQVLPLAVQSNAIVSLDRFTLTNSARYSLELVDSEGRTNRVPAEFAIQVLPDRPPEVKLVFPRGDQRVSSLEELQLQAEAKDDFGLLQHGIGFAVANQEPQFIELGQSAPANETRQFNHQIALEKLGVEVDQVVSYFAWAEDYGPDGQLRRTFSDMFFAEIRPFDEIFRADQSGEGENQNQSGNQGNQAGNQSVKLAELQKQIIIATWKLQRDKGRKTQLP